MKLQFENRDGPVVVTGGAGFIGTNLCITLLEAGHEVIIYDNLSRAGSEKNMQYLKNCYGRRVRVVVADIRDSSSLLSALEGASMVFHFAAQVAVTTSLHAPLEDFAVNLSGTINLLEIIRRLPKKPLLFYTSTNKVYGQLCDITLKKSGVRYVPRDPLYTGGVSESRNLDFHTPYGCSKGGADQYVLDCCRSFGLEAVVFRMSCIYGQHQFGNEDQGWVAHFAIQAMKKAPVTIYGSGYQVRDILFVDDLMRAFSLAAENIRSISGCAFNIGGGIDNTVSLLELTQMLGEINNSEPEIRFEKERCGDQKYYVSDTSRFFNATGWSPLVSPREGLGRLLRWLELRRAGKKYTVV